MCHLVENDICAPVVILIGHFTSEDEVILSEGDTPSVFHRSSIELSDSELIVFFKRIGKTKLSLEIFEPLFGDEEDFAGVEVLSQ